jgi:hypothetical protein
MRGTKDERADGSGAVCLPRIAQFFAGMLRAEEISRDVARRQALLAPDAAMRRFFMLQSRQEALHAGVFRAGLHLASRRNRCPDALASALGRFAARLHADLDAGSLAGSLIGLQGVLEGIGAVALGAPRTELSSLGARFVPLRSVLLRQEAMHHRAGLRWLARLCAERNGDHAAVQDSQRDYADLGFAVVEAGVEIFQGFAVDQRLYRDDAKAAIAAALAPPAHAAPR